MMLRTSWEAGRRALFRSRRDAVQGRAAAREGGALEYADSGLFLPDIQQYRTRGASGDYRIYVTLPSAPPPKEGYPVLYILDGNAWVAGMAEALRLQSRFAMQSEIEPVLLVAIGYPGDAPFKLGRRAYDFLPRHASGKLSERFMQGAPWHQPGGADAFADFLTGPLREDIAARYSVDPSRQILCGHSFGGFFVLRTFLTRPSSFRDYIALSPSLWWDDGELMKQADALIDRLPGDLSASLFIAVGEREAPDRPKISERMTGDAMAMAAKLRNAGPPNGEVEFRIFEGENHQSLPTAAASATLRFIARAGLRGRAL